MNLSDKEWKILKKVYTPIYNAGNLTDLIAPISEIKKIDEIYKNNFKTASSIDNLRACFGACNTTLNKSKSAVIEIKKQYSQGKGLQPCILTECFISQTLADLFGLDRFADEEDSNATMPMSLMNELYGYKNKDNASFRYVYFDDSLNTILVQCGGSDTIDLVLIKQKSGIRIEVKEEHSRLNDPDIIYDENGKLTLTDDFKFQYPMYVPYIEEFNASTDIFSCAGHNYKLPNLTPEKTEVVLSGVMYMKQLDLYLFQLKNKIFPVLSDELKNNVTFEGSEIRTAGRNAKTVFTPRYVKQFILDCGGTIDENGDVEFPLSLVEFPKGRNISENTRAKINSLLFVRVGDFQIVLDKLCFNMSNLCQLKPTISFHLKPFHNSISGTNTLTLLSKK